MADIEYISTRQAALRLGVSLGTVQNMVESGALEAWKTTGGHRRIPIASVEALLSRRRSSASNTPEGSNSLDILITEDSVALQHLYKATFESWKLPFRIRIVDNGFDGLLQVGECMPDVLIVDLMMPGMDGFEMIRRLRAKPTLARMDIIVVSGVSHDEIVQRGLPTDITVYGKPIPFHEIKGFLRGRLSAQQRPA